MPNFLTTEQELELRQKHRKEKDKKLADRIKAILSLNKGVEYRVIATVLLLDEITLRRYVKQYQEKGVTGLLERSYKGGKSWLTDEQENELRQYLAANTQRTVSAVVKYVSETYRVVYSVIGMTKLLHRLGFSYKKPKIIPGKADAVKQADFVKMYKELKQDLKNNDRIYFVDSTHPEHNTKPSYGWILKGKKHDKIIKTNTGRERLNLNGALDLISKTAIVLEQVTINKKTTIKLLKKIELNQPKGKIHLILDNASYHHAKDVQLWLKKHRRFKLHFLPPYSPNLNIIERLWRFFHQQVTWNKYFETFEQFKKTTLKFFKNLHIYKDDLNSLLTDNFQVFPVLNLQT